MPRPRRKALSIAPRAAAMPWGEESERRGVHERRATQRTRAGAAPFLCKRLRVMGSEAKGKEEEWTARCPALVLVGAVAVIACLAAGP